MQKRSENGYIVLEVLIFILIWLIFSGFLPELILIHFERLDARIQFDWFDVRIYFLSFEGFDARIDFDLFWARTDFDFDSFWAVWCKNWLLVVWWNNVSGGDVRPQHWMRLLNNLEWTNKQTHFGRCWAMNNTESTNKQILVEISEQFTISTNR